MKNALRAGREVKAHIWLAPTSDEEMSSFLEKWKRDMEIRISREFKLPMEMYKTATFYNATPYGKPGDCLNIYTGLLRVKH